MEYNETLPPALPEIPFSVPLADCVETPPLPPDNLEHPVNSPQEPNYPFDEPGFEALVNENYAEFIIFARKKLPQSLQGLGVYEDTVQEALSAYYKEFIAGDSVLEERGNSAKYWMYHVIGRCAVDQARKWLGSTGNKQTTSLEQRTEFYGDADADIKAEASFMQLEMADLAKAAFMPLTSEQRELLWRAFVLGETRSALAKHYNISVGSLRVRLARTRQRAQDKFDYNQSQQDEA